jgi:hypothetical protein
LGENHEKAYCFPVFPATQHWPGTIMCDFPQRKSHTDRWLHQHPQEIRVRFTPIAKRLQNESYVKAFSQLLWSGKSSEVWFSLRENHVNVGGFPVFPATQHWPGTTMCDFPQRKSHAVRCSTNIHRKYGFGLHQLRKCFSGKGFMEWLCGPSFRLGYHFLRPLRRL